MNATSAQRAKTTKLMFDSLLNFSLNDLTVYNTACTDIFSSDVQKLGIVSYVFSEMTNYVNNKQAGVVGNADYLYMQIYALCENADSCTQMNDLFC